MPYIQVGIQLPCGDYSNPMPYIQFSVQLPCVDNSHQMPLFQVGAQLAHGDYFRFTNKIAQSKMC